MHNRVLSILVFLFALTALSCKTTGLGSKAADVHGMIYDFSNRPVANCEILLGRWHRSISDVNGRFNFPNVSFGNYTVTGKKKGFESYSETVAIRGKGQIIYIRLPSQSQLLNLVDEALLANDFVMAQEMAERAYQIDSGNAEMLFYYAAVKFRLRDYDGAMAFLEKAKASGSKDLSKDLYIDKFITLLKELRYEN